MAGATGRLSRILGIALMAVAVGGCGGGGGSGGGEGQGQADVSVSFRTDAVKAAAVQGSQPPGDHMHDPSRVVLEAEVTGNVTGTVFAFVRDAGTAFASSSIHIEQAGPSVYRATLRPNVTLSPGTYTGKLILQLCKDAGCAQEYSVSGGSIPYEVTIYAQLQATVLVDGVPSGTVTAGGLPVELQMGDGSSVQITSNLPVQIVYSSGPGFVTVTPDPASTPTSWKGVLARPPFSSTNQITLVLAVQDASRTLQGGATVNVTMQP
jgi:hypothetical protein